MADGEIINFTSVKRVEPDGVVVITESGVTKIRFNKMTQETQREYGYDPDKAVAYQNEVLREGIRKRNNLPVNIAKEKPSATNVKSEDVKSPLISSNQNASSQSSDDLQKKVETFGADLVENEPITFNLGIVGDKSYTPPITEKGRSILIKMPFIQTREGVERDANDMKKNSLERQSLWTWLRQQNWIAGNIVTCVSMVIKSFGSNENPREIYCLATGGSEQYNPARNRYRWDDYWYTDVVNGLKMKGYPWIFKSAYRNTPMDFQIGIQEIKRNLDNGCPVIVSVTWEEARRDKFRAVVVNGYDDNTRVVYLTDPEISPPGLRIIHYKNFAKVWHTLDGTDVRYLLLSSLKE